MSKFFSPFETGVRFNDNGWVRRDGWRCYWQFLRTHDRMTRTVEHDCFAAIDGLVWA